VDAEHLRSLDDENAKLKNLLAGIDTLDIKDDIKLF